MGLYLFITYAVLVVSFYLPFLIDDYKIESSFSGVLISLFFLAIMLPGLFINSIANCLKSNTNCLSFLLIGCGLLLAGLFREKVGLILGVLLSGTGYGIMQPLIYDKTAVIAPPRMATLALSFVMAMNYLAVMLCPFIVDLFRDLFHTHSNQFPFIFNAILILAVAIVALFRRKHYVLGLDNSYYQE